MYIFVIGVSFFVVVWALMLVLVPQSRKPVMWASLGCGAAGPISEYWHRRDYWHPTYLYKIEIGNWVFDIEDYVFAFVFGGICAGTFDIIYRRTHSEPAMQIDTWGGYYRLTNLGVVCVATLFFLIDGLGINSLYAISLVFLVCTVVILYRRPEWILSTLMTAVVMAILMWVFYWGFYLRLFPGLIAEWWRPDALSGIAFLGVPVEEIIWAGAGALFGGPVLRIFMNPIAAGMNSKLSSAV